MSVHLLRPVRVYLAGVTYEVVPVNVHRMGRLVFIVHHDADGFICTEVVDVPFGIWVRVIFLVRKEQYGFIVVGALGLIIHNPNMMAGFICLQVNLDDLGCVGVRICCQGEKRNSLLQIILEKE